MVASDLRGRAVAMTLDEPVLVVDLEPGVERQAQLLDGVEELQPQQLLFERAEKRSAQPLPSGARTKAGDDSMPRKARSSWKCSLAYWVPLS